MPVRIAVFGAGGKMGNAIVRAVAAEAKDATLAVAVERADFPYLAADAAQLAGLPPAGVRVAAERPAPGRRRRLDRLLRAGGHRGQRRGGRGRRRRHGHRHHRACAADKDTIAAASKRIPIVQAPNMSVGVNVMLKLVADAARLLGPGYDIEIVETHHRAKRDAPSGTALRLGEAAAEGSGRDFATSARYERHGDIGPRADHEIGIQTLRGGDVFGDHTVFFLGQGDRVEITHRASSRDTFARGAVRAALWLAGKGAGSSTCATCSGSSSGERETMVRNGPSAAAPAKPSIRARPCSTPTRPRRWSSCWSTRKPRPSRRRRPRARTSPRPRGWSPSAWRRGGRLVFVGVGTAGRIAALEAAECVPLFGLPPSLVVSVLAGGPQAMARTVEVSQDSRREAEQRMRKAAVGPADIVCAVADAAPSSFSSPRSSTRAFAAPRSCS